jgi:hypothetical protein
MTGMPKGVGRSLAVRRYRLFPILFLVASCATLQAEAAQSAAVASNGSRTAAASVQKPQRSAPLPLRVVQSARSFLGVPYVTGGNDRSGLDCSGFTFRIYSDVMGLDLPRGVWGLYNRTSSSSYPLHIGDLLFFDTSGRAKPTQPTHVGLYIGDGRFIHAASEGLHTGVISSGLSDKYYRDSFLGARRVIPWRAPVLAMTLTDSYQSVTQDDPFAAREEITIQVFNKMTGGGPMDLRVFKNGKRKLTRRIASSSQKPAEVRFTPDVGEWTVSVSRIWGGRELHRVAVTVLE